MLLLPENRFDRIIAVVPSSRHIFMLPIFTIVHNSNYMSTRPHCADVPSEIDTVSTAAAGYARSTAYNPRSLGYSHIFEYNGISRSESLSAINLVGQQNAVQLNYLYAATTFILSTVCEFAHQVPNSDIGGLFLYIHATA